MCIGSQTGGALLPNGGAGWAGGKAERILIIIILSPPISWNKAKLALVNPAKFGAQMLQPGALYIAGPKSSPAGEFCQHWGLLRARTPTRSGCCCGVPRTAQHFT